MFPLKAINKYVYNYVSTIDVELVVHATVVYTTLSTTAYL